MKKIDEALQMKVFDLLEGNLSDLEKAEVLNLIAASPELQKEYDLMSKTYLQQEPIVYTDKNKLYHKPGLVLAWSPMMRYAATLTVVAVCGAIAWYFARETGGNVTQVANTKTQQPAAVDSPKLNDHSLSPEAIPQNEADVANPQAAKQNQQVVDRTANYRRDQPGDRKGDVGYEPSPEFEQQVAITNEVAEEVAKSDIAMIYAVQDTAKAAVVQQLPVTSSKKRSLSYKLINNGRQMLANLQLPDIKFKAEKRAHKTIPTIKMEIRTYKTDVIATIIE